MKVTPAIRLLRYTLGLHLNPGKNETFPKLVSEIGDWQKLINQSEKAGLTNLLYDQLKKYDIPIPSDNLNQFRALFVRQRRAHQIRTQALLELVDLFHAANIQFVLLKGAALAHILYEKPEYRPMSDIDILVPSAQANTAQQLLKDNGYRAADKKKGFMYDHHHLPIATKQLQGMNISVEVHHDALSGDINDSITFENLSSAPYEFSIDGRVAYSLPHTDILRHLCHHTLEPIETIKLGAVSDIYGYAVKFYDEIDWDYLERKHSFVINVLRCFHFLSPLPDQISQKYPAPIVPRPAGVGKGFKQLSLISNEKISWIQKLKKLYFCSPWWLHMFYNVPPEKSLWLVRLFRHPLKLVCWYIRRIVANFKSKANR